MTDADPLVGTALGPCRLEALIGRGGMGRVYRARHLALDRVVAVKLVGDAGSAGGAARAAVLSEARAAARLDDPRVVAVYEVGEDRGLAYIVMQWVDGESLEARVARTGPLPVAEALRIAAEVAAALRAAHAAGVVHRDVKPANVLLDARGGVKLGDFGLAGAPGSAPGEGTTVGSYHFMAPEQGWGAPPEPRADLYALGATWFYALTGRPPFAGPANDALVAAREDAAPDVRALRPEVTSRAAGLIARLLAKDPGERPASAEEVAREMSAPGLTLDVDASGSPFRLLAARPPEPAAPESAAPAPESAASPAPGARPASSPAPRPLVAPPPPPPAAAPALGSRASFFALFSIIAAVGLAWPWRRAGPEDFLAGVLLLPAFPVLLTFGDRRQGWRRAAGAALVAGALACFARVVRLSGASPALESLIASGFGAAAAAGAVYLGLWGSDAEELLWGRLLVLVGGPLLAAGALAWSVPEGRGWLESLRADAAAWWGAWTASGGGWRWGGLLAVSVAGFAARRVKTAAPKAPGDRRLNWNR